MGGFSVFLNSTSGIAQSFTGGPWRPPQARQTSMYSLTCTLPPDSSVTATSTVNGQSVPEAGDASPDTPAQQPTTYFLDAVLRAEHVQELTVTKHPVQIGPAIVDHAYPQPARVVLEVAMSDAMASLAAGQYTSHPSKSVSAYRTFKQIQAARVPITLSTRLDSYANMVITDVRGAEDAHTHFGFRGTLYFEQIISAAQNLGANSSGRPNQTGTTNEGIKGAQAPDAPTQTQLNNLLATPPN